MSKIDYKYEAEQLLIGGVIYCKFLVDIVKSNRTGCDVFICGEDDFEPQEFKTEEEAICWIGGREWGRYTITKIYCR